MKTLTSIIIFVLISLYSFSQKVYITKNATIDFFSSTLIEDIKAVNKDVVSIIKTETGEISFGVSIKAFVFENGLMQQHFNENYMESDKFPNAKFKGNIDENSKINFEKDGVYPIIVIGTITIHGVSKEIGTKSIITVKEGKITAKSFLKLKPADFEIEIPALVKDNIARELDVTINAEYSVFEK